MQTTETIRRHLVTGALAGATAIATTAVATRHAVGAEPDPTHALIARVREPDAVLQASCQTEPSSRSAEYEAWQEEYDRVNDAYHDVSWQLIETPPTTLAGLLALIAFVRECMESRTMEPVVEPADDVAALLATVETALRQHVGGLA